MHRRTVHNQINNILLQNETGPYKSIITLPNMYLFIFVIFFVYFSDPENLSICLGCAETVFHAFMMRYAAWQHWHRCRLVGHGFTRFLLQASGGSHLLEISRARWPQEPRWVQPYHSTNLSDRWVYYCTPHTQSIEVRREKSPSEASRLLFALLPRSCHTLSVFDVVWKREHRAWRC